MTSREMLGEVMNGRTYREIGEMCGISRQAANKRVSCLLSGLINRIVFKGVYDYFIETEGMDFAKFAERVNADGNIVSADTLRKILTGKKKMVHIDVISRVCKVTGRPVEDAFTLRSLEERQWQRNTDKVARMKGAQ